MNIIKTTGFQILTISIMFLLMCFLKLWYAMFIFIGIAFIQTLLTGRKIFCNGYCPLGNMQDLLSDDKVKPKSFSVHSSVKISLTILFWLLSVIIVYFFRESNSQLWVWFLRLMLVIFSTAYILQIFYGKRTWCKGQCPVGNTMSGYLKIKRILKKN